MAKIKLGDRPKNFKRTVKFKLIDGSESSIEASYVYRTRAEFGKFIDARVAADAEIADAKKTEADSETFSLADNMQARIDTNAAYLLDVLDGWNLDDALNEENLQKLADQFPAATAALMDNYRAAITEGRLGN